jgi:hypothetical protein
VPPWSYLPVSDHCYFPLKFVPEIAEMPREFLVWAMKLVSGSYPIGGHPGMSTIRIALAFFLLVSLVACGGDDEDEGATMNPGSNCLDCHRGFTAAGTVFNSGDAPASAGVAGATVKLTDSGVPTAKVITLVTNATGNFYTSEPLTMPLQVVVTYQDNVAIMGNATGACSSCHAPGTGFHPARVHVGTCTSCH